MKELIKKIRECTGAGFSECKKAAEESGNNFDVALEILKKKGIEKAAKKIGNDVEHGAVVIKSDNSGNIVSLVFKSQTDFAVKSDAFCKFIDNEANLFLESELDSLKEVVNNNQETFNDRLSFFISTLGENVILSNAVKFKKKNGVKYVSYLHNKINSNFSNIGLLGVILAVNNEADDVLCLNIAKHAAAADALLFSEDQITEAMLAENSEIKDAVLLNQSYFYDDNVTVKQFVENNKIDLLNFQAFIA